MRYLFVLLLLLAVSASATDMGWRVGNGNEDDDYQLGASGRAIGPVFQFIGDTGQVIDSCGLWVENTSTTKTWKVGLYRLDPGVAWNFVDSTASIEVTASIGLQWITLTFQESHVLIPHADSMYLLLATADALGGSEDITLIDSNLTYPSDENEGIYITDTEVGDPWPATESGNYSSDDVLPVFWVYAANPILVSDSVHTTGGGEWQGTTGSIGTDSSMVDCVARDDGFGTGASNNWIESGADADTFIAEITNTTLTAIDSIIVAFDGMADGLSTGTGRINLIFPDNPDTTAGTLRTFSTNDPAHFTEVFNDCPGETGWTPAQFNTCRLAVISVDAPTGEDLYVGYITVWAYGSGVAEVGAPQVIMVTEQ